MLMKNNNAVIFLCGCLFALVACGDNEVIVADVAETPEVLSFYEANTLVPAWNVYGKEDKGHSETRTLDCSEAQALKPQAIALDQPPPPHLLITEISEPTAYNV
ncbi:MAG: hypothetical protein ISP86_05295, partial [Shewanellaceae bacterium]|nr:hypothetical protein [Shewanellaceae bacterium]